MTNAPNTADGTEPRTVARGGTLYRLIWKWHFLAGLLVLPFMAFMAITGIVNLFHDELSEMLYADKLNVTAGEQTLAYEEIATAVSAAASGQISKVFVPEAAGRAYTFEVSGQNGATTVAWADPYTGTVLGTADKDAMVLNFIEQLHASFTAGLTGRLVNEALTSWAIVMFLTGLYLWWPRGARTWSNVLAMPKGEGRPWWRSLHLLVGGFGVILVIPLMFSGLFWSPIWGDAYLKSQLALKHFSPAVAYGGPPIFNKSQDGPIQPLDNLIQVARDAGMTGDLEARPPVAPKFGILIRTVESTPVPDQVELHVDTRTGDVMRRAVYENYPAMAWFRSMMARLHVGSLWGSLSTVLNLAAALSIIVLSVSGFAAWWARRPAGSLGVPAGPKSAKLGAGLAVLVLALAIFMPAMGITLIAALFLDWLIFKRLGWFQPANA